MGAHNQWQAFSPVQCPEAIWWEDLKKLLCQVWCVISSWKTGLHHPSPPPPLSSQILNDPLCRDIT